MSTGLQARVYDPLWLLARQWQVGEFQGEDGGSPAVAQWRGEAARFTRYASGPLIDGAPVRARSFDGRAVPLETLVECEPLGASVSSLERLRFAADTGRQFLRTLGQQALSQPYDDAVLAAFPLAAPAGTERPLDTESAAFMEIVAGRIPDGRALYAAFDAALRRQSGQPALPPQLTVAAADASEVRAAGLLWLQWVDALFTVPDEDAPAWTSERMEYGFAIAARTSAGEVVLTAGEYYSGHLDWHDFDIVPERSLAVDDSPPDNLVRTSIPAPVSYRGMPASRFWQFEDARVDFGAVEAAPQDLARMLLVEFAITYGNDWFVIPIDLDVGTLCTTKSLVVTNTFGEQFLIPASTAADGPAGAWRLYGLSGASGRGAATVDAFVLPHVLGSVLEGRAVEDVLFLRDEMANMAWAVERVVESPIERPRNRFDEEPEPAPPESSPLPGTAAYRLGTTPPHNWVPLLPVRTPTGLRLRRGRVLEPDGSQRLVEALGRVLEASDADGLALYEEEVPREGIRVTRSPQLARWQDGSTHLWFGRRKRVGRGEGSSGLRFDRVVPPRDEAPG
jgi:hypothetical protein